MYSTDFNFISGQPGPPPAKTGMGAELVRCREEEEPDWPPAAAGQAP